jgi:hypothetical protein
MPTDSDLRQTAIEVLTRELKKTRVNRPRCEIALACLTELRETAEDQTEPKRELQDFVREELVRTAFQLELERKLSKGRED